MKAGELQPPRNHHNVERVLIKSLSLNDNNVFLKPFILKKHRKSEIKQMDGFFGGKVFWMESQSEENNRLLLFLLRAKLAPETFGLAKKN